MIKLLKAILRFFNSKAEAAAGTVDIDEVGIIDIEITFEATYKVVEEVKYKINADSFIDTL